MRYQTVRILLLLVVSTFVFFGCEIGQQGASETWVELSNGVEAGEPVAEIWVKGFACPFCATKLDSQLMKIQGVEKVAIDLGSGRTLVGFNDGITPKESSLIKAVKNAGFTLDRIVMP